jgi:hypothetical protein
MRLAGSMSTAGHTWSPGRAVGLVARPAVPASRSHRGRTTAPETAAGTGAEDVNCVVNDIAYRVANRVAF